MKEEKKKLKGKSSHITKYTRVYGRRHCSLILFHAHSNSHGTKKEMKKNRPKKCAWH